MPNRSFRLWVLLVVASEAAAALLRPATIVPRRSPAARMKIADGVVGVGIVGAGRIGLVHCEALAQCDSARAVIISNPTVAKAEAAAAKYKLEAFSADAMEVINHPDVEAVWICSPSQYHAEQIKACAAAGKHIFCEKPIATDLPETIEAIAACNKAGVKLMTALQRRFDPNFRRVKTAIEQGEVGEVVQIKLTSRDPSPPPFQYVKGGGGIFKDMAVHDLDMARFLMDSEPVEILASGSCTIDEAILELPGPEAFDTAVIVMKFASGKESFIDVCRQAPYGYDQRAEVLGQSAMIMTDNNYPNTARIYSADFTGNADMPYDFFMSRYKEAYVQETLAFVDCLVNDKPVPCSGEDGLVALVMAIAAGISAEERRWVKLSEITPQLCELAGECGITINMCDIPDDEDNSGGFSFANFFSSMQK
uniref:Gfo/Idh/MocA-like oxidoreductase N-terminal domain-containing protein n=1 Tax=Coccolithus braarudii TaxID=221442 RepID=A0A7S0LHM4_9EUKA